MNTSVFKYLSLFSVSKINRENGRNILQRLYNTAIIFLPSRAEPSSFSSFQHNMPPCLSTRFTQRNVHVVEEGRDAKKAYNTHRHCNLKTCHSIKSSRHGAKTSLLRRQHTNTHVPHWHTNMRILIRIHVCCERCPVNVTCWGFSRSRASRVHVTQKTERCIVINIK